MNESDDREIQELIEINIHSKEQLYSANMSYIRNGGLFIPTAREFKMGELIMLKVHLIDEKIPFEISSRVVWITPPGAQRGMTPGIGLQFIDEKQGKSLHSKISTYIAGMVESEERTETM